MVGRWAASTLMPSEIVMTKQKLLENMLQNMGKQRTLGREQTKTTANINVAHFIIHPFTSYHHIMYSLMR